jgi:hypothetical protein
MGDRPARPAQAFFRSQSSSKAKEVPSPKVPHVTAPNPKVPNLKIAIAKVPILELDT